MATPDKASRGREAYAAGQWVKAYAEFAAADRESPLEADDLARSAAAAYLLGRDRDAVVQWTRAHHGFVDQGRPDLAARFGFWLSLTFLLDGEMARSTGWLARTRRMLDEHRQDSAERGYLAALEGLVAMGRGDSDAADAAFKRAITAARQFSDRDLLALGLVGHGQTFVQRQDPTAGVELLDEAMVGVSAGDVTPILAGILYCAVIVTCQRIFDLRRAREWTLELSDWCGTQPELVPFRGQCLVHRSEILQLQGDWTGALEEAEKACQHLSDRKETIVGRAFYQRGELHRLRGAFDDARAMYNEASRNGCEPQPGASLLRLAEGDPEAAAAAIRGVVNLAVDRQGPGGGPSRAKLLAAYVEIQLAVKDIEAASTAADELARIADAIRAPYLEALSAQATSAVLLARGDAKAALPLLRQGWSLWQQVEAPYEAARTRALIARICDELGDRESARMHSAAAIAAFEHLGAAPELAQLKRLRPSDNHPGHGLTDRECEVLAHVAVGRTNRQIARRLGISEHTVARHLSNIFDKLGVTSRTAASAFAHTHNLV
jgi:DNA-binding CsgD family transcriptional regulator